MKEPFMPRLRIARTLLTAGTALLVFSTLLPAAQAAEIDRYGYLSRLMSQRISISGQCKVTVKPDEATIVIGLDGDGNTPVEARRELNALVGKVRSLVSRHNGRVQEHDLVRMMRGGDATPVPGMARPNMPMVATPPDKPLPAFVFVQRLDLEFPLSADVDSVLVGLNKLGIKRIGRMAMTYAYYGRHMPPQPVVFYGFREPEKMFDRAHQQCRDQALKLWCEKQAPSDRQSECLGELRRIAPRLTTKNMSLRTITTSGGYPGQSFYLNYPFQPAQLERTLLFGDKPVELHGNIYLRYTGPAW